MVRYFLHILMYMCTVSVLAQPASGVESDSLRVQSLLAEGDTHYSKFENQNALEFYQQAFEIEPNSIEVLTRMVRTTNDYGMDVKAEGDENAAKMIFEDALGYAESLETKYPDHPATYTHLALVAKNMALVVNGRDKIEFGQQVQAHCTKGIELNPEDPELYVTYAIFNRDIADMHWVERTLTGALFQQFPYGSRELALELLQKAIKINPLLHIAHYEIAVTYINLGLHDEAIPYLRNALKLSAQTSQDERNRELASLMLNRLER